MSAERVMLAFARTHRNLGARHCSHLFPIFPLLYISCDALAQLGEFPLVCTGLQNLCATELLRHMCGRAFLKASEGVLYFQFECLFSSSCLLDSTESFLFFLPSW